MAKELIICGPPGCGKTREATRRARQAADHYGAENVLICSMTRAAAAVVAGRNSVIPEANIATLHAHCYRALERPELADNPKGIERWNDWIDQKGKRHFRVTVKRDEDLEDAAVEGGVHCETEGDRCLQAYSVCRARQDDVREQRAFVREFAELWETRKTEEGSLDFQGLIETCLRDMPTAPGGAQVLFVDEVQDLSVSQMALIRQWGEAADHLVLTGDPLQNLYHWAGSDATAFLAGDVEEDRKWVLSQSYRVPRQVQELSLRWIDPLRRQFERDFGKPLEYRPRHEVTGKNEDGSPLWGGVAEGEARFAEHLCFGYPEDVLADAEQYLRQGKTVAFISSCGYMLDPLLAVLRQSGTPFHNPYRVKNGRWNPLAPRKGTTAKDRVLAYIRLSERAGEGEARFWSRQDLWRWLEVLESKGILAHGVKERAKQAAAQPFSAQEPVPLEEFLGYFLSEEDAVQAVEGAETISLRWLEKRLLAKKRQGLIFPVRVAEKRGPEALWKEPSIIVGTAHSLKGGEADWCYVAPDLSPAAMDEWSSGGEGEDGIRRAIYVALTRAKEGVVVCGPSNPYFVEIG